MVDTRQVSRIWAQNGNILVKYKLSKIKPIISIFKFLIMEETKFSTEKLLRGYLQTLQKNLKDDTIMEHFVPSGTKNSQKIKRASISLQVLVSHFSTSYQPHDSKLDSKQQTYLLTTIQKFIVS